MTLIGAPMGMAIATSMAMLFLGSLVLVAKTNIIVAIAYRNANWRYAKAIVYVNGCPKIYTYETISSQDLGF